VKRAAKVRVAKKRVAGWKRTELVEIRSFPPLSQNRRQGWGTQILFNRQHDGALRFCSTAKRMGHPGVVQPPKLREVFEFFFDFGEGRG
jgi:hypothetical protein